MAWTPFTRRHHDRSRMRYASDMTDREWSMIEPFMPIAATRWPPTQDVTSRRDGRHLLSAAIGLPMGTAAA
jgi:hypothetical protein